MNINKRELAACGLNLADIARLSGVSYNRVWRIATGGLSKGLDRDEQERIERVLAATKTSA